MKTTATINQLNEALTFVNRSFDNNIKFKSIEQISRNTVKFTLTVKDSKKAGHRRGFYNNRRLAAACWHVHGYFFEYLFLNFDNIKVRAGNKVMKSNSDNWQDWNIGSNFQPLMFSQACDCN